MKKILRFIPMVAWGLFMTGCYTNVIDLDDDDEGGGGDNAELVIADRTQLNQQIFAESSVCEVRFTSEFGWDVNNTDELTRKWIAISPSHSEVGGSFTLSIIVDENASGGDRTATLQLFSGSDNETITINQSSTYKDGSQPQPYVPDVYTDIVDKIVLQNSSNGEVEPSTREWCFITNHTTGKVDMMSLRLKDPHDERVAEQIIIHDYRILERTVFGLMPPGDRWDMMLQQHGELSVNAHNFITQQQLRELNYQHEDSQEPILHEITYLYSAYRRVSERDGYNINEYRWTNENMTERVDMTTTNALKFAYGTHNNDRANIDINSFLNGEMYAAIGLLGKRSKNLLGSITDYKGGVINFDYSFDEKGRVQTVTEKHSFGGISESTSIVYTIYYVDLIDNDGAMVQNKLNNY